MENYSRRNDSKIDNVQDFAKAVGQNNNLWSLLIGKNDSKIDNVQDFVKIVGQNDGFWRLLIGKEVTRFNEQVKYKIRQRNEPEVKGVKHFKLGIFFSIQPQESSETPIRIDYGDEFRVKYSKANFIKKFNMISPPISLQKLNKLIQAEEAKKQELERQKVRKLEVEKQKQEMLKRETEKREAKRLEVEKQKQEILKREAEKQALYRRLKEHFEQNFLGVDAFYKDNCSQYISLQEYQDEKSNYVRSWIQQNLDLKADLEQAAAIGAVEGHVQVVARAGSGKTSTLVNRALFLQKHCGVAPNEMLLLAFNRKAAKEIQDRLTKQLQNSIPHVMTFHALAYALVHPEESLIFDEPNGGQGKSLALQTVIDDYLSDLKFQEKIRSLMMVRFRKDWEDIVLKGYDKSPEEMLQYRRSLPKESLRGEYLKSFGEKVIANFLFEHGIKYKYERNFSWSGINYRPDFTISTGADQGIIIEYFGLKGDPDYDKMSAEKRLYWKGKKPNWYLLELSPSDFKSSGEEGFRASLKQSLEAYQIPCNRLSEEEIWQKIKVRAIDRFTKAMVNFVRRCRQLILTPEKLTQIIDCYNFVNDVEQRFLELAQTFYQAYLERLQATGKEDFDGLMQRAAELVSSGQTIFLRKSGSGDLSDLRHILIDEYQDFSQLFHRLIEAVREQNPQAQFFCVGDDWQAINGFAGSDLDFYQNFAQFFQPSRKLEIATNYRSATSIVNIGNRLMQGLGTPARADKNISGTIEIADLRTFEPALREQENHPGDNLTPAVLRLISKTFQDGQDVVLLSRKNSLPWYVNYGKDQNTPKKVTLESFLELLRSNLPEEFRKNVTISTAHKYKGLEKKVVIILDGVSGSYPLLHPDLIFTRVLGDTIERVIKEERRLFYVALTRAVEHLFIFTETNNLSPFLDNLQDKTTIPLLNWSNYLPVAGETKRITVKVSNQNGQGSKGTCAIKELLRAEDYNWNSPLKAWWRTYPAQDFSVKLFFDKTKWISCASGIELRFCDDLENLLAIYSVDGGQWDCLVDHFPSSNCQFRF